MTVWGTPCWPSSHAVSWAPWLRGRVSSTQTWTGMPASWAAYTGAVAEPWSTKASQPALQWVRMLTGWPSLRPLISRIRPRPWRPMRRQLSASSSAMAAAVVRAVSTASAAVAAPARFPLSLDRGEKHPVAGGGPDQAGPADMHVPDGGGHCFHGFNVLDDKGVGQVPLVDDADNAGPLRMRPDGAVGVTVNFHAWQAGTRSGSGCRGYRPARRLRSRPRVKRLRVPLPSAWIAGVRRADRGRIGGSPSHP